LTAIVGLWDGETAWMVGDGRVGWGDGAPCNTTTKLIRSGQWIIGQAGANRGLQVLRRMSFEACSTPEDVADCLRSMLKADDWQPKAIDPGRAPMYSASFLLAGPEGLYVICNEFASMKADTGLPVGVGSGGDYASGAAHAFLARGESPRRALSEAIRIAAAFDVWTGGAGLLMNSSGVTEFFECAPAARPLGIEKVNYSPGVIRRSGEDYEDGKLIGSEAPC